MKVMNQAAIVTLIACAALPGTLRAQRPDSEPPPRQAPSKQHAKPPMSAPAAADTAMAAAGAPDMGASEAINQGTVTIRTDGEGQMTIYREGLKIGSAPRALTQRQGTKRWYEVRDEKGAVVCGDTIAIDEPYQRVDRLCRRGGGHLEPAPKPN
jgi:hypothetical protein